MKQSTTKENLLKWMRGSPCSCALDSSQGGWWIFDSCQEWNPSWWHSDNKAQKCAQPTSSCRGHQFDDPDTCNANELYILLSCLECAEVAAFLLTLHKCEVESIFMGLGHVRRPHQQKWVHSHSSPNLLKRLLLLVISPSFHAFRSLLTF